MNAFPEVTVFLRMHELRAMRRNPGSSTLALVLENQKKLVINAINQVIDDLELDESEEDDE